MARWVTCLGVNHELGSNRRKLEAGQGQGEGVKLTDDDLALVNGKRDQLAGRIQERYGIGKDEAERQVSDWERTAKADWFVNATRI